MVDDFVESNIEIATRSENHNDKDNHKVPTKIEKLICDWLENSTHSYVEKVVDNIIAAVEPYFRTIFY